MIDFPNNSFEIYKKADSLDYAFCPIRGEIHLPYYKPEERVRLSLVHFLTADANLYPSLINLGVEGERLDISIYNKGLGEFGLYQPPALIVETKREEFDLIQAYDQLVDYLKVAKTGCGILFNNRQAFSIEKGGDVYSYDELAKPNEIIDFILSALSKQNEMLSDEKLKFENAKNGDFESFKFLAQKHRRNKRIVFTIVQHDIEYNIEGHLFEFTPDCIKYTKCGYDTKSDNKPYFFKSEFRHLNGIYKF